LLLRRTKGFFVGFKTQKRVASSQKLRYQIPVAVSIKADWELATRLLATRNTLLGALLDLSKPKRSHRPGALIQFLTRSPAATESACVVSSGHGGGTAAVKDLAPFAPTERTAAHPSSN